MVQTIKFSEFATPANPFLEQGEIVVGLNLGSNNQFSVPRQFLTDFTTATRPVGVTGMIGFNTDINSYQFFNGTTWITFGTGGTVTSIDTGTGLTGGPITVSGTISLSNIPNQDFLANTSGSSGPPLPTSFIAGSNISIGYGSGTVTISGTGSAGFGFVNVTGTSATMAAFNTYLANNAGLVTLTMPVICAQGGLIEVAGFGAGGWTIIQQTGQQIFDGASGTTITTGSISSTNRYNALRLLCTVANTTFTVISSQGNFTIA